MIEMHDIDGLTALASTRLGNRQFIDDTFIGRDIRKEEFANLFGSKKRKDSIARVRQEQNARWAAVPAKTCDEIKAALTMVSIEVEKLTKLSATSKDFWIIPQLETAREWEGKFKQLQATNRCLELEEEAKKKAERELTLQTLTNLSDTTVEKAKADLAQSQGTSLGQTVSSIAGGNNKLLLYGGIGVGVVLLILLIRK